MQNWKDYLAKYFTNILTVLTFAGLGFFTYTLYEDKQTANTERKSLEERYSKLIDTKTDYEQLSKNVGQLATLYKSQKDLSEQISTQWKDLKVASGERIKLDADTTVTIEADVEKQKTADYTFKTPKGTKGYSVNELRIAGKDSPAIGYILVKDDGQVFKKNYKFEIQVESVQLKDDLTGKIRIVSRAYLIPQENGLAGDKRKDLKQWKDQKYPLAVTGGETIVDPQEPVLKPNSKGLVPWTLNLNAGFGVFGPRDGTIDTRVIGDVNLFGYGYSKQDLDWKFLHLGMNYSKTSGFGFHFMPFTYRPLPSIFTNAYLGPGAFINPDAYGYFLGLNIGL